ncbi:hypothetical protein [Mycobacterium sp. PSTR-4-N]|uniref:hypothetical protein n=1 Tax=Mycobacterium sp. PSTR-4-N TaxID=2917745 RepID=UPI001F14F720|nr:hypothetical protein [Mycobacterium sp. PSTR-4-N]MCG7593923.1 hypothetical protein [Mycobacterium sp. PSTR-4-N]
MTRPSVRARQLRGALVGSCSAVMTAGAHAAAGGGVPRGPAFVVVLLICLTAGALATCVRADRGAYAVTAAALCGAQLSGHVALTMAAHHHGTVGWSMAAAHLGAALLLAAAITSVEFLYAVCVSVLCWVRLFALRAPRPPAPRIRYRAAIARPRPVPIGGTGMRAPPAPSAC